MPKWGVTYFFFYSGNVKGPVIRLGPLTPRCLSNMILFIVLARSKLTSEIRAAVSLELFPLSCFVF